MISASGRPAQVRRFHLIRRTGMTRRFGEPDPDGVDAGAQDTAVVGSRRVAEVTVQFTITPGVYLVQARPGPAGQDVG
jgi:hypothetical protein